MPLNPADFPLGTRFYDVDDVPVATRPGQPPKRYDRQPPIGFDLLDFVNNGIETTAEDFAAMVAACLGDESRR